MSELGKWVHQSDVWGGVLDNGPKQPAGPQLNPFIGAVVLVTDDDPTQRLLARDALEAAGFQVEEAADGPEGVAKAYSVKPALVILDILMPRLDGFSVCAEIRRLDVTKDIPVLISTGINNVEAIQHAFRIGATDFSIKPIAWDVLALRVQFILRNHAYRTRVAANPKVAVSR